MLKILHHATFTFTFKLVTYTFQDRNDFTPAFDQQSYTANAVRETEAPGFQIAQVKAEDEDPEVNYINPCYMYGYIQYVDSGKSIGIEGHSPTRGLILILWAFVV